MFSAKSPSTGAFQGIDLAIYIPVMSNLKFLVLSVFAIIFAAQAHSEVPSELRQAGSYYNFINVPPGADSNQIKSALKKIKRAHHPDRYMHTGDDKLIEEKTNLTAYINSNISETLLDRESRIRYNLEHLKMPPLTPMREDDYKRFINEIDQAFSNSVQSEEPLNFYRYQLMDSLILHLDTDKGIFLLTNLLTKTSSKAAYQEHLLSALYDEIKRKDNFNTAAIIQAINFAEEAVILTAFNDAPPQLHGTSLTVAFKIIEEYSLKDYQAFAEPAQLIYEKTRNSSEDATEALRVYASYANSIVSIANELASVLLSESLDAEDEQIIVETLEGIESPSESVQKALNSYKSPYLKALKGASSIVNKCIDALTTTKNNVLNRIKK